jgi:outer membrane biosynthesis protein TonB
MRSHHVTTFQLLAAVTASGLLLFCGGPAAPPAPSASPVVSPAREADSGAQGDASATAPGERAASKDGPVDAGPGKPFEVNLDGVGLSSGGSGIGTLDGGPGAGFGIGPGPKSDGSAPSKGQLDPKEIRRVVQADKAKYQQCYEAALAKSPTLAGRVSVRFVVGVDGRVASAENRGSTLADAKVVDCVVQAFSKLRFPAPKGGTVDIVYPLDFGTK